MGRTFPAGEEGGVAALHFLANHPATHRFLATKLVRHFVADDPPDMAVRRIEGVLRDTGGDLGAAAAALVTLDAAWQPASKLRTPLDFVDRRAARAGSAATRSWRPCRSGHPGRARPAIPSAPQPNGWPDRAGDWAAPEAMMRRIDWAYAVSGRAGTRDVAELAEANLGPLLRETRCRRCAAPARAATR